MNIHEYQAKGVLGAYGVKVLKGQVAYTPAEAETIARELGGPIWVVKAQIHAGGRGKGGGVKLAKSIEEVRQLADQMLGMTLVTHQTGPAGKEVNRVYIEEGCDIARELYLGMLVDRASSRITVMASTEGGMEIEEVAAKTPEKILMVAIDPVTGLMPYHGRKIAFGLGLEGSQVKSAVKFLRAMYDAFTGLDASMIEINPLVVTGDGEMLMGLGAFASIAVQAPANLAIVVLDNESYGETGMQATHTAGPTDLAAVAVGAGIPVVGNVSDAAELETALPRIRTEPGPLFFNIKVRAEDLPLALPPKDGVELKTRFRQALLGPGPGPGSRSGSVN